MERVVIDKTCRADVALFGLVLAQPNGKQNCVNLELNRVFETLPRRVRGRFVSFSVDTKWLVHNVQQRVPTTRLLCKICLSDSSPQQVFVDQYSRHSKELFVYVSSRRVLSVLILN